MRTMYLVQGGTRTTGKTEELWINIGGSWCFRTQHNTCTQHKHTLRRSIQLQSTLVGRQWTDRICLPLPLHRSPLFLNTSPFLLIPTSLFRKLETREHIVTAGCFHLLPHLWQTTRMGRLRHCSCHWEKDLSFFKHRTRYMIKLAIKVFLLLDLK